MDKRTSEGNQLVALALEGADEPGNELVSGGLDGLVVQGLVGGAWFGQSLKGF